MSGAQPGVTIGPVHWPELRAVARLQKRAFRPPLAYRLPTLFMLKLWPGARFLVARRGAMVVGCAIGDRHEGTARVVNLAVDPDVRRQGVGSALLRALEEAMPGGPVLLMVETGNSAARALYARSGYQPDGDAVNYYGRGQHGVWMRKPRAGSSGAND